MLERIDIVIQQTLPLTYPVYAAANMKSALEKMGVEVFLFSFADGNIQNYFNRTAPIGILTFEEKCAHASNLQKIFGCSELFISNNALIPIAHVGSANKMIALPDRKWVTYAQGAFFPQPIESHVTTAKDKTIKIALFADLLDVEYMWEKCVPMHTREVIKRWGARLAKESDFHPLAEILSSHQLQPTHGGEFFSAVTQYSQANRVRSLIESFHSLPLHIFGEHVGGQWYTSLANAENVHLHALPPYAHILTLLEEIEIVVFEQLPFIDGPPEYFFHALQKGALPLTPPSDYLRELFGTHHPIFYHHYDELIEKCHFYLENPTQRLQLLEELRQIDLSFLSWEKAAYNALALLHNK